MKSKILIAIALVSGLLGACESAINGKYVANSTYRATDALVRNAEGSVTSATPILVATLNDVDSLETSNTFGRIVSEQIAGRLTRQGYDVTELKMRDSLNIKRGLENPMDAGEYILSRDVESIRTEQQAAVAVTGTYAQAGEQIIVNLKMLDLATAKIISATDYTLPLNVNTRRLMGSNGSAEVDFYGNSMFYQ